MKYTVFSSGEFPMLKINSIGFSSVPEVTRFGPGKRNEFIIHYVLKGKGVYNGNVVRKGQGFLITPELFEEYYPDENDPWEFVWIISTDKNMSEVFKHYNADENTLIFKYEFIDVLEILRDYLICNNNKILSRAEILELYLKVFKKHTETNSESSVKSNAQVYIDFAVNYIETNYNRIVSVLELTELLGVSQPYLFKIFKAKLKKSPKQYITEYRMEQAKNLLKYSNLSVTEIANSVGFNDCLSFSKAFSKREKCSPLKYREMIKNKEM